MQETFLRAYRSWETYARGTNARAWLFRTCRNTFLRQQEQRRRRPESDAMELNGEAEARTAPVSTVDQVHALDPRYDFHQAFLAFLGKHAQQPAPPGLRRKVWEQILREHERREREDD